MWCLHLSRRLCKEMLKKFKMDNCKLTNSPLECWVKLLKYGEGEKFDPTFFKSLVGSLQYLTCTRPDILYTIGQVSRYMEAPTNTHLKTTKRIFRYMKCTINFGLFYSSSIDFKLVGYSDSDWAGDMGDRKSKLGSCSLWETLLSLGCQRSNLLSPSPLVKLST